MHRESTVPAPSRAGIHQPLHRAEGRARVLARSVGSTTSPSSSTGTASGARPETGSVRRTVTATGLAVAAVVSTAAMSVGATTAPASAASSSSSQAAAQAQFMEHYNYRNWKVLKNAQALQGTPYRYGGTSTRGFDCSGYTSYVYAAAGKSLPRTSSAQLGATVRVSAGQVRPGDLVFFHSGGRVYHVAIYAGSNQVWHAPGSGERVKKERIWSTSVYFGRVPLS